MAACLVSSTYWPKYGFISLAWSKVSVIPFPAAASTRSCAVTTKGSTYVVMSSANNVSGSLAAVNCVISSKLGVYPDFANSSTTSALLL